MPHYIARVELAKHQGMEASRKDYTKLDELMSSLLFDHTLSKQRLELPAGTFIGSSFDNCEELGKKVADAVLTVWPAPRIVVGPMSSCWSYGLANARQHSILADELRQA